MTEPNEQWGPPIPKPAPGTSAWGWVAIAVIVTSISLMLGFLVKRNCHYNGDQYKRDCYSDIVTLYGPRGAPFNDAKHPGSFAAHALAYRDVNLEYPALTGLFISAVNAPIPQGDSGGFLQTNAAGLSIFALAAAAALAFIALKRQRILLLSLSPALVSYAFHNWDLIPVGFTALAMYAFARDRDALAGAMLGLGAAGKLYPAFLVPVLMLARKHQSRSMRPLFAASVFWFLIPNVVVFAYAGFSSWWFPWKFQSTRTPNFETWGYFLAKHLSAHNIGKSTFWFGESFGKAAQAAATAAFAGFSALLLRREWKRAEFRPFATCFGVLIIFLMTTKVYSPQYAIWLLPFFVVVGVRWYGYALFTLTDMMVLAAIWAYLTVNGSAQITILEIAVYVRYAALGFLLFLTRRAPDLVAPPISETVPA